MNKFLKLPLFLAIVGAITTLALATVHHITDPIIKEQAIAQEKASLILLFPDAEFAPSELTLEDKDKEAGLVAIFEATKDDAVIAYIYKTSTQGFKGTVLTLVSISPEGKFNGYRALEVSSETNGYGTRVADAEFYNQFVDKNITLVNEIQPLDGATVTSAPLVKAIKAAARHFSENVK